MPGYNRVPAVKQNIKTCIPQGHNGVSKATTVSNGGLFKWNPWAK